jgi:XTP/dITP diphosphohydrolase
MQTLLFASNNQHKADEIRQVLGNRFRILTLKEAGIDIDIPEPYETLEENAREKSRTIYRMTGQDCFSEDSGLEVAILGGQPGVRSARYAGEGVPSAAHWEKLLEAMKGESNRNARFRTVISLILGGQEYQFTGSCEGHITEKPSGSQGFGYDPVFVPEGASHTFASMSPEEKNTYSHRAKAMGRLIDFLDKMGI